jgi:hypothetical protein
MSYREIMDDGTVFLEPEWMDTAIIGKAVNEHSREVLVYSYQALIEGFMQNDEMDYESAVEWIEYNTLRAIPYMGEQKPIVVYMGAE